MLNKIKKFLNLTYYTSEIDQFLSQIRRKYPRLSASQRQEKEKYDRIFKLRDRPEHATTHRSFWDKF